MDKFSDLKLRKLFKELDFIQSDFELRQEIVSEADNDFITSINSFLEDHPELKEIYDRKITEKINKSIEKQKQADERIKEEQEEPEISDIDEENEENEYQKNNPVYSKIKKLYRDIVKLTHPDLVKGKKLNDLYIKATEYYDLNDIIGIYAVCNDLDIKYEIDEEDIKHVMSKIDYYRGKISFLESTFTWKWYNCENDEQKNQIMLSYIKMKIK